MILFLSLLTAVLTIVGHYMLTNKNRWGFVVSLTNQIPWTILTSLTGAYGGVVISAFFIYLNIRGWRKWSHG